MAEKPEKPVTTHPITNQQRMIAVGGGVALVVGIGFLLWGLAPVKGFGPAMEVFGGGTPPDDLGEQIDAALAELTSRAWADGLGMVGIMGGIIALQHGMKPKEKTVEERVAEELDRRRADGTVQAGQGAPRAPASSVQAAPPPAPRPAQPAAPSACPTCHGPLVAGGRFCKNCGRV